MTETPLRQVCFMIMPFGVKTVEPRMDGAPATIDFDALWHRALLPLLDELGYDAVRADQDIGASIIVEMLERLYYSDLVLADMSIPNGNVYYEIGVRHACQERGCVLISADWARPLFDSAQMRRLTYPLSNGVITDDDATQIKDALRGEFHALAQGSSPVWQFIPGYPTPKTAAPDRATAIRDQLARISNFQAQIRSVRLNRDALAREEAARAVRAKYPADQPMPRGAAIEVALLLRDCVGWEEFVAYIDALPKAVRSAPFLQEQRSLAISKTGKHLDAIAAIEELIRMSGDTSERRGLLGGRYKALWAAAKKEGDEFNAGFYLDQAIEAYERGMRLDLNDYYPSCNLPRLYRARGQPRDLERALAAAQVALLACERSKSRGGSDEWLNPTLLGMAFDSGDVDAVTKWVQAVMRDGPADWKLATTISDLEASCGLARDDSTGQQLGALVTQLRGLLPPNP